MNTFKFAREFCGTIMIFAAVPLAVALSTPKESGSTKAQASVKAAEFVKASAATVREVPPTQPATGMFLTLTNTDKKDHSVVAAKSTAAKAVELHGHVEEDGMMKMRPVKTIEIKAGGTTELKPGGLHVMLLGLTKPVKDGETVPVTLTFEDGSEQTVDAKVVSLVKSTPTPHAH